MTSHGNIGVIGVNCHFQQCLVVILIRSFPLISCGRSWGRASIGSNQRL